MGGSRATKRRKVLEIGIPFAGRILNCETSFFKKTYRAHAHRRFFEIDKPLTKFHFWTYCFWRRDT